MSQSLCPCGSHCSVGRCAHVLAMVVHHVAADGQSMAPVCARSRAGVCGAGAGRRPDWAPLPVQYADYTIWQRRAARRRGSDPNLFCAAARASGAGRSGLPDQLELPTDRPRPPVHRCAGARPRSTSTAALRRALAELGRGHGASTVHGRPRRVRACCSPGCRRPTTSRLARRSRAGESELDGMIGMFVNTLALRTEIDPDAASTRSRHRSGTAMPRPSSTPTFRSSGSSRCSIRCGRPRRHPIFQVGLSFQNIDRASLELPGLRIETGRDARGCRSIRPPPDPVRQL